MPEIDARGWKRNNASSGGIHYSFHFFRVVRYSLWYFVPYSFVSLGVGRNYIHYSLTETLNPFFRMFES